jgi:hypothetical protein
MADLIQNEVKTLIDQEAWDTVVSKEDREREALREAAASLDGK